MSELVPNILALDKGLDLQSPKITAPPGSVLDMLNYEQVDFQGQKRIDGYTRYDGSPLSAFDDFLLVDKSAPMEEEGPYELAYTDGKLYGVVCGEYNDRNGDYWCVAVIDYNNLPSDAVWAKEYFTNDPNEHYTLLLECLANIRNKVESLPGPISGLHWFRDRLYAVADIAEYTPDDPRINTENKASLFESRSIQQVLDEGDSDFGWKFIHQGWTLRFKDALVPSGILVAKNQNRENVGVQGPTATTGSSGSAQVVVQKMTITNLSAQVNGWKTSTSPSVYNLEASALRDTDNVFIYADAFFSWDGETGEINAIGADGNNLIEYSPTNTVEVEV